MKRLFRTSKPIIDPLPPPTSTPDYTQQPQTQQTSSQPNGTGAGPKKSSSALKLEGHGHPPAELSGGGGGGGKSWFGGSSAPSVTPFPVDAGHSTGNIMRRVSRREKKDKGAGSAPSMLEIQQMQQQQQERQPSQPIQQASHESLPYPPSVPKQTQQLSRFYEEPPQPELSSPGSAWTVLPPNSSHSQQQRYSLTQPGYSELSADRSHTPPLPIPIAPAMHSGGGSGRSSPSSAQLYLPPGARPPTPPAALRPATPNYGRSPMGRSQSSLNSHGHTEEVMGRAGTGRDRGYSSASGSMRGSDVESSTGHGLPTSLAKPNLAHQVRSPLAHAYANPPNLPTFPNPQPHPYVAPPGTNLLNPYSPLEEDNRQLHVPPPPSLPPPQQPQQQVMYEEQQPSGGGKDKEKKKFWGMDMGWGGGKKDKDEKKGLKDKEKDKDQHLGVTQPQQDGGGGGRRSFDWSRAQDHQVGQAGYTVTPTPNGLPGQAGMNIGSPMVMEDEQRGRMAGRMFFRDQDNKDPSSAKDVTVAIQMLCANPDPSFSAIYGVCDRVNNAETPEAVCKEAARAIRKLFKHGNESERRAVAVVWLLMMRNVPAIRPHAASKKVLASVEPILMASPQKALVNANTHRTIVDILADLAFNFGGEKGCEPLLDLWRKVKMQQEPDNGRPLPDDHQIFTPEAQYPTHMLDRQGNIHHQGNSPYMNHESNGYHHDSQVEDRLPGPGYANLPSHNDDMRRLLEESMAGKEAARVLSEALVYSRPEDLDQRPIISEFYNKCFHAHESLTNQMEWAQAEARSSRERTMMNGLSLEPKSHESSGPGDTIEESALAALFEAHAALSEAIRQHDELDRMAMEQREMSEVRERSKKDMRMGRDDPSRFDQNEAVTGFLSAGRPAQGSSSRSPSPARGRIEASPRGQHLPLPPFSADTERSRTPSPDHFPLPPRLGSSPIRRPASPLGARAPRPLPNPFKTTGSNASLKSSSAGHSAWAAPSTMDHGRSGAVQDDNMDVDDADLPSVPLKPSRKALGKRPAQPVDPDNHFDPNDMFAGKKEDSSAPSSEEESASVDEVFFQRPIKYAYDAYQEKIEREARGDFGGGGSRSGGGGAGGGGSTMRYSALPRQGGGSSGIEYGQTQGSARVDARA